MFLQQLITLHLSTYSHGDIKSDNIMLTVDLKAVKIIDLGFARQDYPGVSEQYKRGTPTYAAPELGDLKDDKQRTAVYSGFEVDLFAVGVLIFFMVTK